MKKCAFLFTVVLFLAACATTQQYVPLASFENLSAGNALIKVERRNDFIGSGRSLQISDNGKMVGTISPGKYLIWQRPAGEHCESVLSNLLHSLKMTDAQFDELWTFVKKRRILDNKRWRDDLEEISHTPVLLHSGD